MKFQKTSKEEIKHIAAGTALCTLLTVTGIFFLSMTGLCAFGPDVILGALGGAAVAVGNFCIMCLTVQKAVGIAEPKRRSAFLQGSYNARLLLQAGWIRVAFLLPELHVVAASLPLLFPGPVIFCLRRKDNPLPSRRPGEYPDSFAQ